MHQSSPPKFPQPDASAGGPSRILTFEVGLGFLGLLLRFCHVEQWPCPIRTFSSRPYSVAQRGRRVFPDGPARVADDSFETVHLCPGPFVPGKASDLLSSMYGERRVACSRVAASMCCNL
jgi:hypothetical protein